MSDNENTYICESGGKPPQAIRHLRQWSVAVKRRIVEETFVPGASVSIVARRHNLNANLLFNWRRKYRQGELVDRKSAAKAVQPENEFVRIGVIEPDGVFRPVSVSGEPPSACSSRSNSTGSDGEAARRVGTAVLETGRSGIAEIELPNRLKVRFDAGIDEATLRRLLAMAKDLAC